MALVVPAPELCPLPATLPDALDPVAPELDTLPVPLSPVPASLLEPLGVVELELELPHDTMATKSPLNQSALLPVVPSRL